MTHDYIPTTVVTPHVENAPSSENTGATPAITENEDMPMVVEQMANEVPLNNDQEVEPE
jgi:hypothetical protein